MAPDHEVVMRDGSKKQACELVEGESLMPFYRKASSVKLGQQMDGYETVYDSASNRYVARIECLSKRDDVYCMEILGPNGEHDRHNFAVLSADGNPNSGIMVGNCKYGDLFAFIDVSPDHGVINVFPIPVNEIEREEGYDPDDPLAVRFRWVMQGNQVLENWQVAHMRLMGNDAFLPYGSSVLEPARRVWR